MKFFNKKNTQNKETTKLPMGKKSKKALAAYAAVVLCLTCFTTTAFAANDPITVVNNLSDFIFGLIRAARLRCGADWSVPQITRPVPESKRLSDPCRRCHHYLCKGDSDPHHPISRAVQRRYDIECHREHPRCIAGCGACPACAVFCGRRNENLR